MVGANAVATKDVRPYHVNVGIPAKSIRVKPNAPPDAYVSERVSRRDHVAVFVVRDFRQTAPPVPGGEITAHGFFPIDELPNDTTAGTRARIIEVLGGAPMTERW